MAESLFSSSRLRPQKPRWARQRVGRISSTVASLLRAAGVSGAPDREPANLHRRTPPVWQQPGPRSTGCAGFLSFLLLFVVPLAASFRFAGT